MAHKRSRMWRAVRTGVRASSWFLCAAVVSSLLIASNAYVARAANVVAGGVISGAPVDDKTLIVRLRSFAPRANGRLLLQPTAGGGRARLTANNLPRPQTLAPNARTFVAWASGGRIIRLGELRRDSRGVGSLVFPHPAEFARYSLIVTAEADARAERPTGAPVFSTRANEVAALFPEPPARRDDTPRLVAARRDRRAPPPRPATAPSNTKGAGATVATTAATAAASKTNAPSRAANAVTATTALRTRGSEREGGEFFTSVDEAIKRDASARTLTLVGDRGARRARGTARVATLDDGTAYVRMRFRRVPPPSRYGRGRRYAIWALNPENLGTTYMGTLPAHDINRRQTYARTEGINSNKFRLLVTAERRTPAPRPAGRRVLMTFKGRRRK